MAFLHGSLNKTHAEFLKGMVNAIPDGVVVAADGQLLYVNDRFLELLDLAFLPGTDLSGLTRYLHPSDEQYVRDHLCDPWEHGIDTPVVECTVVSSQGIERDVELRTSRLSIGDRRAVLLLVRATGVSMYSATNPPHREMRYQRYLESNSGPLLREADGHFYYASRAALDLLGIRSLREVYGRDFIEFVKPEMREEVKTRFRESRFNLSPTIFETVIVRPDGEMRDVRVRIGTIPCSDGGLQNVALTDITQELIQQRRLETSRRISNATGYVADLMIKAEHWHDVIHDVLSTIGQSCNASYVRLLRYDKDEMLPVQVEAWPEASDRELVSVFCSLLENSRSAAAGFQESLFSGQVVQFLSGDVPPRMRHQLQERRVALIVVLPLDGGEGVWGGLWVEFSDPEQEPTDPQLVALKGCAATISGAMRRQEYALSLAQTSSLLSIVLNYTPDGIYMLDLWTECFDFVSDSIQAVSGYSAQEWHDEGLALLLSRLHVDDREKMVRRLHDIRNSTRSNMPQWPPLVRQQLRFPDGTYRLIEQSQMIQYDDAGRPVRLIGSMRDIIDRSEKDRRVARAFDSTDMVFEGLNEGLVLYREDGCITAANQSFCRMLGCDKADVRGQHIGTLLPASARSEIEPLLFTHHSGVNTEEISWARGDGTIAPSLVSPQYSVGPDERSDLWYTAVMDISQRKAAEQQIRHSEERFRSVFENMGHVLLLFDSGLRLQSVNGVGGRLLGLDSSWCGTPAADIEERLDVQPRLLAVQLERSLRNKRSTRACGAITLNGVRGRVEAEVVAFCFDSDKEEQVGILLNDVTDSRRQDKAIRHTESIQFAQALARGTAHDFVNLLAVTRAIGESICSGAENPDRVRSECTELLRSIERAVAVSHDMLDGRLGQPEDEDMVVALNPETSQLQQGISRMVGSEVDIHMQLATHPIYVRIKQIWYDRILLNLCANARDAMPGGGLLTIQTSQAHISQDMARSMDIVPGEYGCLSVSDTGGGIKSEQAAHLFDYQYTTRQDGWHFGLGLATVRHLVNQSRGSIKVQTSEGNGTTFVVYLPTLDMEEFDL